MSERDETSMRELAAAYALGALSSEEARAFEAWLATSPEAQREVAEYREVSAMLGSTTRGPLPPEDLKARVMSRIASDKVLTLPPIGLARRRSAMPFWIGLAASLVLAAGLGAVFISARRELATQRSTIDSVRAALAAAQDRLEQREKTLNWILEPGVELSLLNSTGGAQARIQLFRNRLTNIAMVHAFNLPPVASGQVYQLWFIRDGKPVPSVTFNSEADGHAMVENITVPTGTGITHAAVTVEPEGGSQAPTSAVILLGSLASS